MCMAEKELTVSKIRELFEEELSALEGVEYITNSAVKHIKFILWFNDSGKA